MHLRPLEIMYNLNLVKANQVIQSSDTCQLQTHTIIMEAHLSAPPTVRLPTVHGTGYVRFAESRVARNNVNVNGSPLDVDVYVDVDLT